MNYVKRNWFKILIFFLICFSIGTIILISHYTDKAETFGDNILIEFFIGGLLLIIPIIIGSSIGKGIVKNIFYNDIETVVRNIKEERRCKNINEEGARNMVKTISETFGRDILENPLLKEMRKLSDPISHQEVECGICGLEAQVAINNHCMNCKLDCFLWENLTEKKDFSK